MPSNRANATPKKQAQFLDSLRAGRSVGSACTDAGVGRRTAYDWRERDANFAKAWDDAIEEGTDRMEDEAYRRAVEGTDKPVYQRGAHVGSVREYSDLLMIFMLKARRPEKYVERSENVNTNYTISDEPMAEDDWERQHSSPLN